MEGDFVGHIRRIPTSPGTGDGFRKASKGIGTGMNEY